MNTNELVNNDEPCGVTPSGSEFVAGPAGFEPVTPGSPPQRVKASPEQDDALPVLYLFRIRT